MLRNLKLIATPLKATKMSIRSLVSCVLLMLLIILPSLFAVGKPVNALPNASTTLREYVDRPDSTFGWQVRQRAKQGSGEFVELTLTSQTWQGSPWKHQLFIYRPAKIIAGGHALLLIDGGSWSDKLEKPIDAASKDPVPDKVQIVMMLADMMQTPVAVIKQVPEQPLFNGLKEDQIIALTFTKFFETSDKDWPLLLPMVKSAVRAMDAVQAFSKQEWQLDVDHFLVTGASKRGWTTWLTAATDARVDALAPMVINMLNMKAHDNLQRESFGQYSDEIQDYTKRGLHAMLLTEKGATLQAIVDPIAYRKQLMQPKLIILATNDAYWPVDALNLYWNDLAGDKYILYVPNNGHGIQDFPRVASAIAALQRSVTGGPAMPKLSWSLEPEQAGEFEFKLRSDLASTAVRKWSATSPTRDFRSATWSATPVKSVDVSARVFHAQVEEPTSGYRAAFLEAEFKGDPTPFVLTTTLHVIEPKGGDTKDAPPAAE
jgi:PhoPQ-activated pathogenicity-related protein